jgi:hypothetical protein
MDCIHLSQGREKSRALVDTVIQHWVLKMQERSWILTEQISRQKGPLSMNLFNISDNGVVDVDAV